MPNEQLNCHKTKVKDEWYEKCSDFLIEFKSDIIIFMQRVFPVPHDLINQQRFGIFL